ncbi:MAG: hypothetical protein ACRD0P_37655, partial [Stackebrandtia sp.]
TRPPHQTKRGKDRAVSDEPKAVSQDWRHREPLTGTDLTDFLALRRVCGRAESRLRSLGEHYVENGRPLLPFLADSVTALIEVGHLTLGDPAPASGDMTRPVMVTATGRARYETLCDRQGLPAYPVSVGDGMAGW